MGSLMLEENVVSQAGTVHHLSLEQIRGAISDLGYQPRQRNVFYELVEEPVDEAVDGGISSLLPQSRQNQHPLPIVN
jgi:cyclic dehypoxanthinyl futalosine synthase